MKPEHEKILLNELIAYNWKCGGVFDNVATRIIDRIEALQDKPRRVLGDEAIFHQANLTLGKMTNRGFNALEIIDFAHAVIAAEQALQLEPVMQKVTVRIYRSKHNNHCTHVTAEKIDGSNWILIDTIEKEYPIEN